MYTAMYALLVSADVLGWLQMTGPISLQASIHLCLSRYVDWGCLRVSEGSIIDMGNDGEIPYVTEITRIFCFGHPLEPELCTPLCTHF